MRTKQTQPNPPPYTKRDPRMIKGKSGIKLLAIGNFVLANLDDAESYFSNCSESTAKGMFSWSGLHLDSWGGFALYMVARNTAETVGMYAVLLSASSHVSPINWQSRLNILLALLLFSRSSCFVTFLPSPVNCKSDHNQGQFRHCTRIEFFWGLK